MALPGNGVFVVHGEMTTLMTAMRRGSKWNSSYDEDKSQLMKLFVDLKQNLNRVEDLHTIQPEVFLKPFLEVIRTDETTGAVTSLALSAISKFLSYGLIDPTMPSITKTVELIVDAVTHARFMGTDQSSDGVTLFRVVEVLHTLMRNPEGSFLSNEAVREMMLSCFKISFEPRLSELLRRSAEQTLKDMVLMLFTRLPQFSEDAFEGGLLKKLQMNPPTMDCKSIKSQSNTNRRNTIEYTDVGIKDPQSPEALCISHLKTVPLATTPATPAGNIYDMQGKITHTPLTTLSQVSCNDAVNSQSQIDENGLPTIQMTTVDESAMQSEPNEPTTNDDINSVVPIPTIDVALSDSSEYVNSVGVRFTQTDEISLPDGAAKSPYGLPCIHELFWFLIMLCNPMDKQNTDTMMHMGLNLLTVAFEVGADNVGKCEMLLKLVKDNLCRHLLALMNTERLTIFAANLQLCFLIFESLRGHLKFQLEAYLKRLTEIISTDNPKVSYEMRELAMDNLLQLSRISGFSAELYINYDCNLYSTDTFENLINLLSKFTLSATNAIYGTHLIAMDTLILIIENIERNCVGAKTFTIIKEEPEEHEQELSNLTTETLTSTTNNLDQTGERHELSSDTIIAVVPEKSAKLSENALSVRLAARGGQVPLSITREYLFDIKRKKRTLTQGTELFNQRPDKGIQYLQENNILKTPLDPMEIALFLRENPGLDKKMIGEYISKKKNVDSKILMNFVSSFDFNGLRIDQALRLYLETFRLPGEAPLIFLVLEHFADHWHKQNGEPFSTSDAAFSLAYAIIMLNMDQHNSNAKRLNVPMTQDDFLKNLRGLNGGSDFEQNMLATVFNEIKNEEIVMPAEQTGIVRENYLWKVLLRRGITPEGVYYYVDNSVYDKELFKIIWGASLSVLSFMFDKSNDSGYKRTVESFRKCGTIMCHYDMHEEFDALILTLCKFTTLLNAAQQDGPSEIVQAVNFGVNTKAQLAMHSVFNLVHDYGDTLREGWRHIFELYLQLFRLKLLPKTLMEVEDFCEPSGKAQLVLRKPCPKQEVGLFSSLYSYLSSDGQREPSYDEQELIKIGKTCIKECHLDHMIQETKFLQLEALNELFKTVLALIKPPTAAKVDDPDYAEDVTVFWVEILVHIVIQNRDRMEPLWKSVRDQMLLVIIGGATYGYEYLLNRSIVALFKLASYLMRNEELCSIVLQSLKVVLMLHSSVILQMSRQISAGMYELLRTSAQNIHSEKDWDVIFTILECVGAGSAPPELGQLDGSLNGGETKEPLAVGEIPATVNGSAISGGDEVAVGSPEREYYSDSDANVKRQTPTSTENWILVNKVSDLPTYSRPQSPPSKGLPVSALAYNCTLLEHSPDALFKCWQSLVFIVRNVAHITPYNFESCVRCIRIFVEACCDGGPQERQRAEGLDAKMTAKKKGAAARRVERNKNAAGESHEAETRNDADENSLAQDYESLSIQLLDLMYTLYTRTAKIFRWWAEEGCTTPQCSALWAQGWCPLLKGISRLAMDRRRAVRTYAISCLQQRALLMPDLQTLSGAEWASCFQQVLFPLLNELLPESSSVALLDPMLLEESRIRMATIMSKVFLHHLTPLIDLGNDFNELWLEVLDYIEKFMKVGSDMLVEQMQEILKNMLLVMHSVRLFHNDDGTLQLPLWELTWRRIGEFLPNLKADIFAHENGQRKSQQTLPQPMPQQTAATAITTTNQPIDNSQIDSPRANNIILTPPEDYKQQHITLVDDTISPSQGVNILLQKQETPTIRNAFALQATPTSSAAYKATPLEPAFVAASPVAALPDIVSDASKVAQPLSPTHSAAAIPDSRQQASIMSCDYSISIDVPETLETNIYHTSDADREHHQLSYVQSQQYLLPMQQQLYNQQKEQVIAYSVEETTYNHHHTSADDCTIPNAACHYPYSAGLLTDVSNIHNSANMCVSGQIATDLYRDSSRTCTFDVGAGPKLSSDVEVSDRQQ